MKKILLVNGIILNIFILLFAFATDFSVTVILIFCISAVMVVYGLLNNRKLIKIFSVALTSVFILFIGFNIFIYSYGKADNVAYSEDALVVLGAGVNGETPSLILAERLKVALQYYNSNPDSIIVVSGGQGHNEDITEALAMERYLVNGGVPIEKIFKEEKSTSTFENFAFSKRIIDEYFDKPYNIAILTNDFHIFRSMMIASNAGFNGTHIHAKIPKYAVPANYLRETIAILFQVILSFDILN
jgi:uncharacterized SAM-binding protein YcdF (DUF218 family)